MRCGCLERHLPYLEAPADYHKQTILAFLWDFKHVFENGYSRIIPGFSTGFGKVRSRIPDFIPAQIRLRPQRPRTSYRLRHAANSAHGAYPWPCPCADRPPTMHRKSGQAGSGSCDEIQACVTTPWVWCRCSSHMTNYRSC